MRKCKIDECGKKHAGNGFCQMHNTRWKKYGDPLQASPKKKPCLIADCDRFSYSRGFCQKHYQDELSKGRLSISKSCSVNGCDKFSVTKK